jgi:cobalt-zinc-cadmium efflux system membrane fusion protein
MTAWRKFGRAGLAALALGGVFLMAACSSDKQQAAAVEAAANPPSTAGPANQISFPADSPKLAQIKVEPVATADVPGNVVIAPGKIEVNPNRVSHVVLPVAGRVMDVLVKLGDAVKQGDPILRMESPDADAAVSAYLQAQAQVSQANSALIKASADLDRARDLFEHNAVARKEVLSDEAAVAQAKASLEQAQATVKQSLRRLEILGLKPDNFGQLLTVSAPISGKIMEVNVVPGEFRNDLSASLITIADLSSVWVSADVPESDIRFIDPGERIDLELIAYPGEVFRGKVARIADTVDPQTRTVKVRAELDNPRGRLRPEMFGKIRHEEGAVPMPVVPAGAIIQGETSNTVYREVTHGVFEPVNVTLGERIGDRVAIKNGLSPGARIVTDGVMLLHSN